MGDRRKSRRSSILKPPKPRNPLSDVDLNPPSTDATFMKSRRVSFANSNFIKEFTADPEKNTIWHNSYEEEVNKSEDSKNIEQPTIHTLSVSEFHDEDEEEDEFNCTKATFDDSSSFETPLVNSPLETSVCSSTHIDLTLATNDTVPLLNSNHPDKTQFDEVTHQRDRNSFSVFDQLLRNPKRSNAFTNMEITGSIPANSNLMKNLLKSQQQQLELGVINKENVPYCKVIVRPTNTLEQNCNMDLTQTVPAVIVNEWGCVESSISDNSVNAEDCSMEITQTIPTSITTNPSPRRATTKPDVTIRIEDEDMETTRAVPGGIQFACNSSFNNKTLEYTRTVCVEDDGRINDMEFTQAIPTNIRISELKHGLEDNMEFTAAIPSNIKISSINSNNVDDNNMEFTQAIPSSIKLNNLIKNISCKNLEVNMELTAGIKIVNKCLLADQKPGDMELTAAIPDGINLTNDDHKTDMEFTQVIPGGIKLTQHTIQTDEDNMEFTQAIPGGIQLTNKTQTYEDNMEFTQAIPGGIKLVYNENNENHRENKTDMEFTQVIPGGIKLTQHTIQTDEDNMEFTQALPGGLKYLLNNSEKLVDNIEAIPDGIKLVDNKKVEENTEVESAQPIARNMNCSQKIPQDMEMTAALPSILKLINYSKNTFNITGITEKNDMDLTHITNSMQQIEDDINLINKDDITEITDTEFINKTIPDEIKSMESSTHSINTSQKCTNDVNEFTQVISDEMELIEDVHIKTEEINHTEIINNSEELETTTTLDESSKVNDDLISLEIQTIKGTACNTSCNDITQHVNYEHSMVDNEITKDVATNNAVNNSQILLTNKSIEIPLNVSEKNDLFNVSHTVKDEVVTEESEATKTIDLSEHIPVATFANIFHLKGYPLVLSPDPSILTTNSDNSNKSDICLRIKYPGEDDDDDNGDNKSLNVSEMETTSKESFSMNKSSFVDSTEKLINYQINYSAGSPEPESDVLSNKRRSSDNICDMSNIPRKLVTRDDTATSPNISKKSLEISPNISREYETDDRDENVAWKFMVEKTFINNDVLSSEDVSLVNSFDSGSVPVDEGNSSKVTSVDAGNSSGVTSADADVSSKMTASEYLKKIDQDLKEVLNMSLTVPIVIKDSPLGEQRKSTVFRKRFDESIKVQQKNVDLTLEQKILQKSNDGIWDIVHLHDLVYTFSFMFETIVFDVHVAETSGNVTKIEFYSQFCEETSHPAAIYVHKMLKKKLTRNFITSALGEPYSVLSLLDLMTVTGEQMLDVMSEFEELDCRYGAVLDNELKVQIEFFDLHLGLAFEVTLNLNNIENISRDDVSVKVLVGEIDENAIKKLLDGCPQGIQLLRTFIVNVQGYIKFLKSIKRKRN